MKYKEDDKVYDIKKGWGYVDLIEDGSYPVVVTFKYGHNPGTYNYSHDGRLDSGKPLTFLPRTLSLRNIMHDGMKKPFIDKQKYIDDPKLRMARLEGEILRLQKDLARIDGSIKNLQHRRIDALRAMNKKLLYHDQLWKDINEK